MPKLTSFNYVLFGPLPAGITRFYMEQLLDAIEHLHVPKRSKILLIFWTAEISVLIPISSTQKVAEYSFIHNGPAFQKKKGFKNFIWLH